MVALPGARGVTVAARPVPFSTLATDSSELDQTTLLSEASEGVMVAERASGLSPTYIEAEVFESERPLTGVPTFTRQVAILPPSFVTAWMVASPAETPVTSPSEETVATPGLSELQFTSGTEAFSGRTVTFSWRVSPGRICISSTSKEIPVTRLTTVTLQVSKTVSETETVITATPALSALTLPFWSTWAISGLSERQARVFWVASEGKTEALRVADSPSSRLRLEELILMSRAGLRTETTQLEVILPSEAVAVIDVVPGPIAVTVPSEETDATLESALVQVTLTSVASSG